MPGERILRITLSLFMYTVCSCSERVGCQPAEGAMAEGAKPDSTNTSLQSTPTTPGSGQSVRYVLWNGKSGRGYA